MVRPQQANERYDRACRTMVQSRLSVLKGTPGCAPKAADLVQEFAELERQRLSSNEAQLTSGGDAGDAHVISNSIDDADSMGAAEVTRSKAGHKMHATTGPTPASAGAKRHMSAPKAPASKQRRRSTAAERVVSASIAASVVNGGLDSVSQVGGAASPSPPAGPEQHILFQLVAMPSTWMLAL